MKLLLVAYYYPPVASGGTQRPVAMAKYLPRFGIPVTVLTHTYDRLDDLHGGVLRIRDPSHNLDRDGLDGLRWLARRLYSEGINRCGRYHSIYSSWLERVSARSDAIIETAAPDLVLASYPPVENLEIGLLMNDRYGVPLVGDFRDGLLFEAIERRRIDRYRCVEQHYRRLEATIAERAVALITAFPDLSDSIRETYGRSDVVTIPNGFDPEDFDRLDGSGLLHPGAFNIVHTGRFGGSYSGMDVRPLCAALATVITERPDLQSRMRLHLIGRLERHERRSFSQLVRRGVVVAHGEQPRSIALAAQTEADALLLLTTRDRPGNAPGKLFEYLRAGRPILALAADSYAAQIIEETGAGRCVDPEDPSAIAHLISASVAEGADASTFAPDAKRIDRYSRETQMRRLAEILKQVDDSGRSAVDSDS